MLYSQTTGGFYSGNIHGSDIPADAVEITDAAYAALLAGQSEGKRIMPGQDGKPMLADPPAPTMEHLAAQVRTERNARLTACDWTQMPDAPLTSEQRAAWVVYRQALRDVPEQPGFPLEVSWPVEPV